MNRRFNWTALALATCVMALGSVAQAEDLKSVENEIIKAAQSVKSYTSDMNMKTEMASPMGAITSEGKGTFAAMRKGGTLMFRMQLTNTTTAKQGETEQKFEQEMLTVSDGDAMYSLVEQFGQKMATKNDVDPKNAGVASKEMFDELEKDNELKLLPEGSFEGKPTYVIEVVSKTPDPMISKMHMHFLKEHGLVVQIIAHGADGKPMQTITYDNMKVNVDLKPDMFKFVAPEGVQIQDMTGGE